MSARRGVIALVILATACTPASAPSQASSKSPDPSTANAPGVENHPTSPTAPNDSATPCSGPSPDLLTALSSKQCRPSRDAPATPASASRDLAFSLSASATRVAPGGHLDLTLAVVNRGTETIPLYFSGDLVLGVEVTDAKGATIAPPSGNAPKNADSRCMEVECRLPESHVELAPGARASAVVGWDATTKVWPAKGPTACCAFHVDSVSGGPLPPGTYRLKLPLPYETKSGNPADPDVSIVVTP